MESIILSREQFTALENSIREIRASIASESKRPAEKFIDNQEFMQLFKISKRTAQYWRDEGKIAYSQIGTKVYYRLTDVEELLEAHYVKAAKRRIDCVDPK
ncbi:MAG: hypothetical protein K0R26_2937 [Bacteroidota bacterium]|jgi:hypothetical protein|nr:hypothetical protein [Bacteroidota bacterium]